MSRRESLPLSSSNADTSSAKTTQTIVRTAEPHVASTMRDSQDNIGTRTAPRAGAAATKTEANTKKNKIHLTHHMVAGVCAGLFSKSILQPLDLVKTRLQVQRARPSKAGSHFYKGVVNAFGTIVKREGVLALYTGLGPNLFGSGVSWGSYFLLYNVAKSNMIDRCKEGEDLSPIHYFSSAAFAGIGTCLITNPIWMIKTRLQLQFKDSVNPEDYNGFIHAARCIVREEGFLSLYRGIGTALTLVSNGALQFMAYEQIKKFVVRVLLDGQEDELISLHFLGMGAIAKVFSSTATYPLQVTKSRIYQRQSDPTKKMPGIWKTWRHMYVHEGIRGFYRGVAPQMLKTAPSSALTFLAYEEIMRFFR